MKKAYGAIKHIQKGDMDSIQDDANGRDAVPREYKVSVPRKISESQCPKFCAPQNSSIIFEIKMYPPFECRSIID